MENAERGADERTAPGTAPEEAAPAPAASMNPESPAEAAGSARKVSPSRRWVLVGSLVGCLALGGGVVLGLSGGEPAVRRAPGPAPGAQAGTAVRTGVPAALPDLAVLIGQRESRVRAHPRDARSWAVLGTAYVEQGGAPQTPPRCTRRPSGRCGPR